MAQIASGQPSRSTEGTRRRHTHVSMTLVMRVIREVRHVVFDFAMVECAVVCNVPLHTLVHTLTECSVLCFVFRAFGVQDRYAKIWNFKMIQQVQVYLFC